MSTTQGDGAGRPTKLPRQQTNPSKKTLDVQSGGRYPVEQERSAAVTKPDFSRTHRSILAKASAPNDRSSQFHSNIAMKGASDQKPKSQATVKSAAFRTRSASRQDANPKPRSVDDKHAKVLAVRNNNASKKTPKAVTTLGAPAVARSDSIDALAEEDRQLQRELLPLHVLHSTSADVHGQWRDSAKRHFHVRFSELAERHTEIADISFQTQELRNRSAVVHWCRNVQASEIDRRVQTLSKCIHEINENLDPNGKFSNVIESFEIWHTRIHKIQGSREHSIPADAAVSANVEEIGAGWQNDVDALQRRLSLLTGEFRTLGSASANSALGRLLVLLQDLVLDMLAEVDCLRSIEYEMMAQEKLWLEDQITSLSLKVQSEMRDKRKSPSKPRSYVGQYPST
ncbi:MAG: hypothetical protein LQ350_004035 [Teloschistes chrysophthalmus]|nr:MAG: hypothetical protein LQ350_004035 [Niorma chrysophthalma]